MHSQYTLELLQELKKRRFHRAVDTTLFSSAKIVAEIAANCELFLVDLKLMDSERHKFFTGVSNETILANIRMIAENGCDFFVRIPLIEGVNADDRNIDESAQKRIIQRLVCERYIDDERYARAYVKDKIRYNKWGQRKIQQGLWLKRIDPEIQQQVLDEIDDNEYLNVLRPLLHQKRKTIKAQNDYELNQKLVRFAIGRGFTFDIIRQCLDVEDEDELVD